MFRRDGQRVRCNDLDFGVHVALLLATPAFQTQWNRDVSRPGRQGAEHQIKLVMADEVKSQQNVRLQAVNYPGAVWEAVTIHGKNQSGGANKLQLRAVSSADVALDGCDSR